MAMCARCSTSTRRASTARLQDSTTRRRSCCSMPMRRGHGVALRHMLDLGCGTGLAGAAFRPPMWTGWSASICRRMIDAGAPKGLYDPLDVGDLLAFLRRRAGEAPIWSSPPMCSSMWPISPRVRAPSPRVLAPGGLFASPVETHDGRGRRSRREAALCPWRRFRARLRSRMRASPAMSPARASTRTENRLPVPGLLVVAPGDRTSRSMPAAPASLPDVFTRWFAARGWAPRAHPARAASRGARRALGAADRADRRRQDARGVSAEPRGVGRRSAALSLPPPPPAKRRRPRGGVGVGGDRARGIPPPPTPPPASAAAGGGTCARGRKAAAHLHRPRHPPRGRAAHALHLAAQGARGRHRAQSRSAGRRDGPADPDRDPHRRHAGSKRQRQRAIRPTSCSPRRSSSRCCSPPPTRAYLFGSLKRVILDELHSLVMSKRGDLLSLGLARLSTIAPRSPPSASRRPSPSRTICAAIWCRSRAASACRSRARRAGRPPDITMLDTAASALPWAGHSARHALPEIYELIKRHKTTLVFVNTRSQAEMIFQQLWGMNDDNLAIALHHGSLDVGAAPQGRGRDGGGQAARGGLHLLARSRHRLGRRRSRHQCRRAEGRLAAAAADRPRQSPARRAVARRSSCPPTASRCWNAAPRSTRSPRMRKTRRRCAPARSTCSRSTCSARACGELPRRRALYEVTRACPMPA